MQAFMRFLKAFVLIPHFSLHIRLKERLSAQAFRDGGVESLEVSGILHVRAGDQRSTTARIRVDLSGANSTANKRPTASFQTHPNMDKSAFQVGSLFPFSLISITVVGVLLFDMPNFLQWDFIWF